MPRKYPDLYTVEINDYQPGDKIKLSPFGEFKGLDGRLFVVDAHSLEKTHEAGIDLPLNVEHGYTSQYNARAVGWIPLSSLEIRDDGIYGTLELNDEGKKLIEDKSYRYLSPEFVITQTRDVILIEGVALTNRPNLQLEINEADPDGDPGGESGTDDNASALSSKPDPYQNTNKESNMPKPTTPAPAAEPHDKNVETEPGARIQSLQSELNQRDETIKALEDELKEQAFNAALADGKVLPKEKEVLLSLTRTQLNQILDARESGAHMQPVNPKSEPNDRDDDLADFEKQMNW